MENNYFCKKRCVKVDVDFEICNDCVKRELSGFGDKEMCIGFNICYEEEKKNGVM